MTTGAEAPRTGASRIEKALGAGAGGGWGGRCPQSGTPRACGRDLVFALRGLVAHGNPTSSSPYSRSAWRVVGEDGRATIDAGRPARSTSKMIPPDRLFDADGGCWREGTSVVGVVSEAASSAGVGKDCGPLPPLLPRHLALKPIYLVVGETACAGAPYLGSVRGGTLIELWPCSNTTRAHRW